MCGIVGYTGRGSIGDKLLQGLQKLEYRGYEAAELKHGPIALLEASTPVVAIMNRQAGYEKMTSSVKEVMAREAPVICIGTENDPRLETFAEHLLFIPECPEYLSPILNGVMLQLLAYECAKAKGLNVDQPRNLAKSVTVE
ncbi:MAG: SIS domain-containing protein [Proteobacteria bacterium]|nr:SIS domain-containing protein [Pseudomonadota bacterium]